MPAGFSPDWRAMPMRMNHRCGWTPRTQASQRSEFPGGEISAAPLRHGRARRQPSFGQISQFETSLMCEELGTEAKVAW